MQVMITAIWPSFARLPNHIAADQGITTAQMVSFFLCEYRRGMPVEGTKLTTRATSLACTNPLPLHSPQQPPLSLHHQVHPRPRLLHRHAHMGVPFDRRYRRPSALFLRQGQHWRVRIFVRMAVVPDIRDWQLRHSERKHARLFAVQQGERQVAVAVRPDVADCLHLHRFHRHRMHLCRRGALRLTGLESGQSHCQLAESSVPILCRVRLLSRRIGRQHLREQSVSGQRPGRDVPLIHQHSTRPAHLRPGSMGHGSLENPGYG